MLVKASNFSHQLEMVVMIMGESFQERDYIITKESSGLDYLLRKLSRASYRWADSIKLFLNPRQSRRLHGHDSTVDANGDIAAT